jgi:glycosyltransferase involved in cell wall biosynthesis
MAAIAYWMFNYRPQWEAASKEVHTLLRAMRRRYDVHLLSFSFNEQAPSVRGNEKRFPLPLALPALPWMAMKAGRYAINHLFASPAERLLTPRLARTPAAILTLAKDSLSLAGLERNASVLERFRYIVVECERHRELLRQLGVPDAGIKLIYPGVKRQQYVPADGPFTVLFATSPMGRHDLLSRGVMLLVQAARQLPDVRFVLAWRKANVDELHRLIEAAGVTNVQVLNGYIPDMAPLYAAAHATILPGIDAASLKPCPHSGLESLAHGKPLLVSRPTSLSDVVERTGCGIVFEPTLESLVAGIEQLRTEYERYQVHCHPTVEGTFSRATFVSRYRQLYDSLL